MFAYCGNNPIIRKDTDGAAFETVFDVVSLVASAVEVYNDPSNIWAWAGFIGDVVDVAVPFVTGVGETTRALATTVKVADKIDDIHDAGNTVKHVSNSVRSGAVRKAWKNEFLDVQNGGSGISRIWSPEEQMELLSTGKVKGYHGHHMKSVKRYSALAGDPTNIQFLTPKDHLAAHGGNWRNVTHGRYEI